jgi:ATP synthase protein I
MTNLPPDDPRSQPDPEPHRRRVEEIDAQLKAVRAAVEKPRPEGANQGAGSGMSQRQTSVAYRVMVDMIAGLLVGGFLGYWLDRWLGWTPWSLVIGLILGFIAGVNNAWRAIRDFSKEAAGGGSGGERDRRLP